MPGVTCQIEGSDTLLPGNCQTVAVLTAGPDGKPPATSQNKDSDGVYAVR